MAPPWLLPTLPSNVTPVILPPELEAVAMPPPWLVDVLPEMDAVPSP